MFLRFTFLFSLLFGSILIGNSQNVAPKKLLIYYGFPSKINSLTVNTQSAANEFSRYEYVVWPDNIENATINPVESGKSHTILTQMNPATKVYGYVSLSMKIPSPLSLSTIEAKLQRIKDFGFKGVLFDECGYVDSVTRDRLTAAVTYAHERGLAVMANTLYSTCLYDNVYNATYNPSSKPTPFTSQDGYLFESHVVIGGNYFRFQGEDGSPYDDWDFWRAKSDTLRQFQKQLNFKVFSVTTPNYASDYDSAKYRFAWYCAWLWGHEATGWSEYNYSSDAPNNTSPNKAPFREPPTDAPNPGNRFLTEFARNGNEHFRFTNTGRIYANTQTKQAGFISCGTVVSQQNGSWTTPASWQGNRVPYPCDGVTVQTGQLISVNGSVTARKLLIQAGSRLAYDAFGKIILVGE
ncbi:hypothetical protein GCM10028807_29790 [Spirosoma daeguense]